MKFRSKIVYLIAGLLAFLPLSILIVVQSIFALEASYDSTLIVDANKMHISSVIAYDEYNKDITYLMDRVDNEGKPILFSILEATNKYILYDFHGGKIDGKQISISGIQFELRGNTVTKLLNGVVYLQFKNVAFEPSHAAWARDAWARDFIEDANTLYKDHFEKPASTVSFIWVKIITASLGTILGMITVLFVVLRKSTKALIKRYWRIAVLVALAEGTIILGLIAWVVVDIFQVFAAATIGWAIFLGVEKIAMIKGYLDGFTRNLNEVPPETLLALRASIDDIVAKYKG